MQKKFLANRGFTLVEVMIVVAILAILGAIAIPLYQNYITNSKQSAAQAVLEQFPVLIETYRAENGRMCPACTANGNFTYNYAELTNGNEDTTVANRITTTFPDFRAKGTSSTTASLYHYQVVFTVAVGPPFTESAVATALPQVGRGAPAGNIVSTVIR